MNTKKLDLHHRIYIALSTCLLLLACVAAWFFVANEREAILTQQEFRRDVHTAADPATGLQAAVLSKVDSGFGIVDKHLTNLEGQISAGRNQLSGQITGIRGDVFGSDGQSGAVGAIRDAAVAAVNRQGSAVNETFAVALNDKDKGILPPFRALLGSLGDSAKNTATASIEFPGLVRNSRFLMARSARTAGHIEQMADTIEGTVKKDVPRIADSIQRIADSVDRWIERLTAPASWKAQLKEWLRLLVLVASRLL